MSNLIEFRIKYVSGFEKSIFIETIANRDNFNQILLWEQKGKRKTVILNIHIKYEQKYRNSQF